MTARPRPDDLRLEEWLSGYFRPEPIPAGLARRIVRAATTMEETMKTIARTFSIQATRNGVALVARRRPAPSTGGAGGRAGGIGPAPEGRAGRAGASADRLAAQARRELREYLNGERSFFSVPVDLSALPEFQRRVLEETMRIPFGEARSYTWIARRIGRPRAVRAVGTALGRNPVPFIVPCHRVLRSDGSLGGYAFGLGMKRRLLELERATPLLEGCRSTHIVCRVGCGAAQRMRSDHRVVFGSVAEARTAGYRPCRVCRPAAA
ncbi:MAG TPA: methylated-DNA--[protein]-cysteine S-methyltransferase [Candidatus Polarisedimenticolia bacterium]|nr:methylated-DNA--[protein]-cysteine S-methyltransferase [Candidatus Polarisedimenticolia bacterium]